MGKILPDTANTLAWLLGWAMREIKAQQDKQIASQRLAFCVEVQEQIQVADMLLEDLDYSAKFIKGLVRDSLGARAAQEFSMQLANVANAPRSGGVG